MAHDHGASAFIRRIRRGARQWLNNWLVRLRGTVTPKARPLAGPTRRILLIRLNKRLGNALFTTPLLRSLAASFPDAEIDVLMRGPANAVLLRELPGVRMTHVFADGVRGLWPLVRGLRRRRFDLAILPSASSSSDRFAVLLCGARQRLGFAGPSQWLRLSHAAAIPDGEHHQGRMPLALLRDGVIDPNVQLYQYLSVRPNASARAAAARIWADSVGPGERPVLAFFKQATGDKQLPRSWWQAWLEALRQAPDAPRLLEILPSPDTAGLAVDIPGVHLRALDQLAALIGHADLFMAADGGPMHLAAAAGTPTLGLFRSTSPAAYGPLGPNCRSLEGKDIEPGSAAEQALSLLRSTTRPPTTAESPG